MDQEGVCDIDPLSTDPTDNYQLLLLLLFVVVAGEMGGKMFLVYTKVIRKTSVLLSPFLLGAVFFVYEII